MLELINKKNAYFFDEFVQDYEEEFSHITGKKKNPDGDYCIDVTWHIPNIGYYWKENRNIVGFCIINFINGYLDIAEFYVIPSYRKKKVGKNMAFAVFNKHRGPWQVRQLLAAESAQKFWKHVISEFTKQNYTELKMNDPKWGQVVCQRFNSN